MKTPPPWFQATQSEETHASMHYRLIPNSETSFTNIFHGHVSLHFRPGPAISCFIYQFQANWVIAYGHRLFTAGNVSAKNLGYMCSAVDALQRPSDWPRLGPMRTESRCRQWLLIIYFVLYCKAFIIITIFCLILLIVTIATNRSDSEPIAQTWAYIEDKGFRCMAIPPHVMNSWMLLWLLILFGKWSLPWMLL